MEISFKNVLAAVLIISLSVALGIIMADKWAYNQELKRQQRKLNQNGQLPR